MNKIFIDTNIFYNILFETKLTQAAQKLLEDHEECLFHTSLTVVNELLHISTGKYYQTPQETIGPYSLRRLIADKGYPAPIINDIQRLLKDYSMGKEILVSSATRDT